MQVAHERLRKASLVQAGPMAREGRCQRLYRVFLLRSPNLRLVLGVHVHRTQNSRGTPQDHCHLQCPTVTVPQRKGRKHGRPSQISSRPCPQPVTPLLSSPRPDLLKLLLSHCHNHPHHRRLQCTTTPTGHRTQPHHRTP